MNVRAISHATVPYPTGKPWILTFMWMLTDKNDLSKHHLRSSTTSERNQHNSKTLVSQQDTVCLNTTNITQQQPKEVDKKTKGLHLAPKCPRYKSN